MGYRTLRACVEDLERAGQLTRIDAEVDPYLEVAEIHRRVQAAGGPALLFTNAKGCGFPLASNLFGTVSRLEFIFRDSLAAVRRLVRLKVDPGSLFRHPWESLKLGLATPRLVPRRVRRGAILQTQTELERLPKVVCWPKDGGPFITLPQVYSEDPKRPGWRHSNLGMYRVQLAGNDYAPNREVGLHYQIHRGIGVHHAAAVARGEKLRVSVCVGGPPAMSVAAVMPLPEGLPELAFAGVLGGHRVPWLTIDGSLGAHAEADFCLIGHIAEGRLAPEGPFGDHLGYYSLRHDFPVMVVEKVYCRRDAIWPFTVVGRPPQEDTSFGKFIHDLTGPVVPTVVPGVKAVHAVDAAGVHPLMLAIGAERYTPYADRRRPQELLTQAHAILGQGQMSLAKYLLIVAEDDDPCLEIHDVEGFFRHLLARFNPSRDLHFQTRGTIDTLDYSGSGLNEGSKVVIAAVGPPLRTLANTLPPEANLPSGFSLARLVFPGVVAISGPAYADEGPTSVERLCSALEGNRSWEGLPLCVVADDSSFVADSLANFLWTTFTRSDPAADIHGAGAFQEAKHWGCRGPLVIDARIKPHHAPVLESDPAVVRRVEALAARGAPLHGLF